MNKDDLRALQAPLKDRYKEAPSEAQTTLTARGTLDLEQLACRIPAGRGETIEAGLHPLAGGDGSWACSGDLLLESLAACAGVTLCAVATATGASVTGGEVIAEGDLDLRGTLGVSRDADVGFSRIRLLFRLNTTADDAQLKKLAELTERYCVVAQSLRTPISLEIARTSA
ncbi:MAG: OsmC family peroxiredoxin [Planctomycetota bacterium]|nr:MAG: OsmC family peroxiredoxin [Planctomycetota bacterium]REK25416.1 MAG: OsmC family peroxiredoxin [Planctomycetota bacterium]REK38016.1 MAG: OsmC family peroxiredoxin [Planctomycetota bacterium]